MVFCFVSASSKDAVVMKAVSKLSGYSDTASKTVVALPAITAAATHRFR